MRATSSTLFVRVNTGVTENAGLETRDSRKVTLENPKPTRVTEFNVQQKHMTYTSGPCKPKTINSALRHQCRYVIQFKIIIIIIIITTFSQCSRYK